MMGAPADAKNSKLTGVATRFLAAVFRLLLAFLFRLLLPSAPKPAHTPAPSPPPAKRTRGDDLPRLFRTFDRDGDGKITALELRETLADLGIFVSPRDLAAAIAEVDANGDGCVDEEEFVELYQKIVGGKAGDDEEEMKETFDVFDENGDGFITAEELWKVMGALGLEQGRMMEECRRMIGSVDVDGDGKVDFAEFQVMMRKENQRFGEGELVVSNC